MQEPASEPTLSIADVARETGLGKDSLRAWERRYGFPTPQRNAQGERLYTQAQVDRLRSIQRLLLSGLRPGKVVGLAPAELASRVAAMADRASERAVWRPTLGSTVAAALQGPAARAAALAGAGAADGPAAVPFDAVLQALHDGDTAHLRHFLSQAKARLGLAAFVIDLVAPLATRIGQAWMDGHLQVYEEHFGMEQLHNALRQAMHGLPEPAPDASPRVLLTTLPGETHGLGLLMVEAVLALEGCHCINLGVQTPVPDIAQAARHYRADIVGLSAAGGLSPRQWSDGVAQLRSRLPAPVALWLGGHGACFNRTAPDGVEIFNELQSTAPAVHAWRACHGNDPNAP